MVLLGRSKCCKRSSYCPQSNFNFLHLRVSHILRIHFNSMIYQISRTLTLMVFAKAEEKIAKKSPSLPRWSSRVWSVRRSLGCDNDNNPRRRQYQQHIATWTCEIQIWLRGFQIRVCWSSTEQFNQSVNQSINGLTKSFSWSSIENKQVAFLLEISPTVKKVARNKIRNWAALTWDFGKDI